MDIITLTEIVQELYNGYMRHDAKLKFLENMNLIPSDFDSKFEEYLKSLNTKTNNNDTPNISPSPTPIQNDDEETAPPPPDVIDDYGVIVYPIAGEVQSNQVSSIKSKLGNTQIATIRLSTSNSFGFDYIVANNGSLKTLYIDCNTDQIKQVASNYKVYKNLKYMFRNSNPEEIIFTKNHNFVFTAENEMIYFTDLTKLKYLDFKWFDLSKATKLSLSGNINITNYYNLKNANLSNICTCQDMFYRNQSLKKINIQSPMLINSKGSCYQMFSDCSSATEIKVPNLQKASDTQQMFYNCSMLEYVDLSSFDMSEANHCGGMFYNCSKLKNIDGILDMRSIQKYNSKAQNWANGCNKMFYNCPNLTGVKIKNPPSDFASVSGLNPSQYTIV